MTHISREIHRSLIQNSTIFLDQSISAINSGLSRYNNKLIAIVNMQMALELALKAQLIKRIDIRNILHRDHATLTDDEIACKYENNTLKVKEFEQLKNYAKSNNMFDLAKLEYRYIEVFQEYRNQLVHFNHVFTETEDKNIEQDIFYVLINILSTILDDILLTDEHSDLENTIILEHYDRLLNNTKYQEKLKSYLENKGETLSYCPICSKELLTPSKICMGCFSVIRSNRPGFGYTHCKYCNNHSSVIFDTLNLNINGGIGPGLCLKCKSDTTIFACPECGSINDLEGIVECCTPHKCINKS